MHEKRLTTGEALRIPQSLDNFSDVVFLEEADSGDACGTNGQAGTSVRESNSAKSEDRNIFQACLPK
jgi:hypothetical protein